jgi:hypothetical protein
MNTFSKVLTRWMAVIVLAAITLPASASSIKSKDPFEMMDDLDKLDKDDFVVAVAKADACTRARDFACAESALAKASKLVTASEDKSRLLASNQTLTAEKRQVVLEEQARERERERERELERQRVREEERQRVLAVQREMQAEEDRIAREDARDRELARQQNSIALYNQINQFAKQYSQLSNSTSNQTQQLYNAAIRQKQAEADAAAAARQARANEVQRQRQEADEQRRNSQYAQAQSIARAEQAERDNQRRVEADRATQERAAEQKRQQREAERLQQERLAQQEQDRQRREKERADQLAKQQAEKDAQRQREAQEQADRQAGIPDRDGCYVPRHSPECANAGESTTKGDKTVVRIRNNCSARITGEICVLRKDGSTDCGSFEVRAGGLTTNLGTPYSTGRYAFKYTGSTKASSDWVCKARDKDPDYHAQNLKDGF